MFETCRATLHAWQCDHMGHINVRAYAEKFEEACWQLYAAIGITPSLLRSRAINMAAVQQNIGYRRELLAGDVVVVRSAMVEVRDKVLRFVHEMRNAETGEVAAVCEFTVVCLDAHARRSRAFPAEILERARKRLVEYDVARAALVREGNG
jgi:acyl-CoA thioester hydrolase